MLFQYISILYFPLSRDFGNLWLRETAGCGRHSARRGARDAKKKNHGPAGPRIFRPNAFPRPLYAPPSDGKAPRRHGMRNGTSPRTSPQYRAFLRTKKRRSLRPAFFMPLPQEGYMSMPIHVLAAQPMKKEMAATPKLMESISRNCGRKGSRRTTETKKVNRQMMQAALNRQNASAR